MSFELQEYVPLAPFTAWRIGGPARWFVQAPNLDTLVAAYRWAVEREIAVFVLGGGSNMLMSDQGWPGLVIRVRSMNQSLEQRGDLAFLTADAGIPMAGTSRKMAAQGWAGLQWAEGLPGTLGGALYGNAGCYGGDMTRVFIEATMLMPDGSLETWAPRDFTFDYRSSRLKQLHVAGKPWPMVLSATLRFRQGDPQTLTDEIARIAAIRKSKTPSGSSCGSVFKNPLGMTAGRLLEESGLKGMQVGGAQVAEKHANYILNVGNATASDVLTLAEKMRTQVRYYTGIDLEFEVRLIGPHSAKDLVDG